MPIKYYEDPAKELEYKLLEASLNELDAFSKLDKLVVEQEIPSFTMPEPTPLPPAYLEFIDRWKDQEFRKVYSDLKDDLGIEYKVDPASYTGFIEESSALYEDVISASEETEVNPSFLYNVAMQEGLANKMSILHKANMQGNLSNNEWYTVEEDIVQSNSLSWDTPGIHNILTTPIYESDRPLNTFRDIGLDTIFMEEDKMLQRGHLKSPISTSPDKTVAIHAGYDEQGTSLWEHGEKGKVTNEAGLIVEHGYISSKDALRGTGALIRINQDYLRSSFAERGVNFDELPEKLKNFWTYASFNAGAGNASKLFKTYGHDPYRNQDFINKLKEHQKAAKIRKETGHKEGEYSLADWMENVGRVVGGTELTSLYEPFN